MTIELRVAGRVVTDAVGELTEYGVRHHRTVARYDLGGVGDPDVLTLDEVVRTRIIASRISAAQAEWFVARAETAPWSAVPVDADLADADPMADGGLYAAGIGLDDHFRAAAPRGVGVAKIHKVLHLKRPALVPILDSHLLAAYGPLATSAAASRPALGARRLYWVAIRDDLTADHNRDALGEVRRELASYVGDEERQARVRALARLSDLRLLDAVAWRSL